MAKRWHARLTDTAASTRIEALSGLSGVAARNASAFTTANGPGTNLTASLNFNGTSDKVAVGTVQGCPTGANIRSFIGWIYVDAFGTTNERRIFSQNAGGSGAGTGFECYAANNAIALGFNAHRKQTTTTALSTATWYHIAVIVPSGSTTTAHVKVYIDGADQSFTDVAGSAQTLNTGTTDFILGNSSSLFFDGRLSDWRIYDTNEAANLADIRGEAGLGNGVVITTPKNYQTYQRDGSGQHDLTITGTYTGSPTTLEARFNGGSWTTIVASPAGGTFSGTLNDISGQGKLEVRHSNDTSKIDTCYWVGVGDVFVAGGQSNMEGKGTNYQLYSHASIRPTKFTESGVWAELTDPSDSGSLALGSLLPLLATQFLSDQSVPCAFITTALDGTGLSSPNADWKPPSGTNYTNMTATVTASGVNSVKKMLFFQGEKDAANSVTQATYYADIQTFAAAVKADLPGAPLTLLGCINDSNAAEANHNPIRYAQVAAWATADIQSGPTTHDIDVSDGGGDGVHFKTDAELQLVADRWWLAIDEACFDGVYGTPPRISTATFVSDLITVTYDRDLKTATTYGGFTFTDDGTPIVVSSATKTGARTVVVDLASAPSGTTKLLLCGKGFTAQGQVHPQNVGGMLAIPEEFTVTAAVAPTITTGANHNAAENQTAVVTLAATGDTPITWSITGGADQAKFSIVGATGVLTFPDAPDYEIPTDADTNNVYVVQVTATNAAGSNAKTLNVTVTDVGEGGGGGSSQLQSRSNLSIGINLGGRR